MAGGGFGVGWDGVVGWWHDIEDDIEDPESELTLQHCNTPVFIQNRCNLRG